jgi:hypothetical protein
VIAAPAVARAADPSLEVSLEPKTFGIEDTARIVVRILEPSGSPTVDLGEVGNLEVVAGPSSGTEFSWINGAATRASTFTYVVQGLEVGPASVGPVTVRLGDTELSSEVLTAEVVPGSVAPPRSRGRTSPFPLDPFGDLVPRRQPSRSARVELRQLLDRNSVVLGQPVTTWVVLDTTSGGVDGFEWIDAPSYPGWWAQRVDPPERITSEVVEVDGVRYNRFVVARHVLVPLKTGSLTIPEIGARIGFRSASIFGPQQVVERQAAARVVEVSQRPRAPEGFSGAVGDLQYRASLQPETIEFGESAVLSIELRGSGNLPLVEAPALWPECADCESYPPEEESSVTVDERGIRGSRIWRTTLVPRSWGELDLTPVVLAVFDPAAGHYRTHTLGPLELVVEAPPATPTPVAEEAPAGGEDSADDAQPAGSAGESSAAGVPQWLRTLGVLVLGLVIGGAVALVVARRRRATLPPRHEGESPAERARTLQVALERWWLDARNKAKGEALEDDMRELRKDLEAVRFAPGRADHSETVADLEERVKSLMRRA